MKVIAEIYKRKYLLLVLVLAELLIVGITYKILDNRNYELEKVNLFNRDKSKMFAMYTKAGDGDYEPYDGDSFPSMFYTLNRSRSGCVDGSGNNINAIVSFNNGEVAVKTKKTVYCYLYFDFSLTARQLTYDNHSELKTTCTEAQCAIDELYAGIEDATSKLTLGLSKTMEAGLYRYQGLLADNYICFGTTDKNTCVGNTDRYMYRIIGNDSEGKMKLIKKEALNTNYSWYSSRAENITWPNSDIYKGLNGSYFLTNTTYIPSGWEDRIADTSWKYGDFTNENASASEVATAEQSFSNTVTAKIGLMYIHDMIYGFPEGKNCSSAKICKPSWIYLKRKGNDPSAPSSNEWTITRYGKTLFYYQTWVLHGDILRAETLQINTQNSVRPVFFLKANQNVASGSGTLTDPFILS